MGRCRKFSLEDVLAKLSLCFGNAGLPIRRSKISKLRTSDGEANIELIQFYRATGEKEIQRPLANTPGIRHIAFVVKDIEAVVAKLKNQGAEIVGRIQTYDDTYKLCYIRGPEGIILELAEPVK